MPAIFTRGPGLVSMVRGQSMAPANLSIDTGDLRLHPQEQTAYRAARPLTRNQRRAGKTPAVSPLAPFQQNSQLKNTIVTGLVIQDQVNVQFTYSLDSDAHAFVFGDKLSQINISGFAFGETCVANTATARQEMSGLAYIQQIYRHYRLTKHSDPIFIAVADVVYQAFLIGGRYTFSDAASQIAQYELNLVSLIS